FLLFHRFLYRLDKVRALLIGSQARGMLVGFFSLRIFIDGDALIGVVKHAPDHLQTRSLGRSRPWLGLGLGLLGGLPLPRGLFLILFFVSYFLGLFVDLSVLFFLIQFFFLIDLFVLVLPPLRGLVVGTQILAVQNASGHEIPPVSIISEIQHKTGLTVKI